MEMMQQRVSFGRVVFILAATVVVLAGLHVAAPVLNPIFFAIVFSLLCSPVYAFLCRRLPNGVALVLMLVGLLAISLLLFYVLGASISRLTGRLSFYASQLNGRVTNAQDLLDLTGLSSIDLGSVVKSSKVMGALGTVLSGVAGFLSNLFLIIMIMLFLLSEGPAMMDRVRSGVSGDSTQLDRLTFIGRGVVRQFGLRAIVNFVTAAGITVLLIVLGVDFALLWGVLSFFLSFVPYIGLVLATTPAVLLALAEFGFGRTIFVIAGVVLVNILAENVLSPVLMGRGLSLSPTVVFLSFVFWAWILGGPGAFLALPITLFVAVMLETFPETRWVARLMGMPEAEADALADGGEDAAAPG